MQSLKRGWKLENFGGDEIFWAFRKLKLGEDLQEKKVG
jgi:hypothetical protein